MDALIHVTPIFDLRDHEESERCWCSPRRDQYEPTIIIHNALDGREAFETGERKPS